MTSGKYKKRKGGASQTQGKGNAKAKQKFYKPSKPVPTLDRSAVSADNPLGDHAPAGHHRYRPERWTGSLSLSLEARTPLLLLDGFSCRVDGNRHKTLDTRAQLLRTQLKGALRSAYEMITNSRLGCVKSSHSEPLQFRKGAKKQPYECAPMEIFKIKKINPASCLKELSPAERVFGWVNPEGKGAYKGQLRVSRLELDNPPPPNNGPERTLAPLSSPRPEYVRFYGAEDLDGRPFPRRWDKAKGYTKTAGDAGRNDYFTHPDKPEGYFGADVTPGKPFKHDSGTYYPEYLVNDNKKSDQNMTVRGEVPAGTRFSACVQFHNLSDEEFGALLWLLTLEEGAYYSLGSGKPFGFGSIRISLASFNAWHGQALKARYASLFNPNTEPVEETEQIKLDRPEMVQSSNAVNELKQKFKRSLENAYGKKKSERLLRIFKEHRHGPSDQRPVHYPRTKPKPGEPFKWFSDSEKLEARWSLGDTWDGPANSFALPYHPVNPQPRR